MGLSDLDHQRLADIVELQPTRNAELKKRWGLDSGSDVHQYLEDALSDYYFRDGESLIRATPEAAELVDVEPGVEDDDAGHVIVRVPKLQRRLLEILPDAAADSMSVVAALHALGETDGSDPSIDEVRDGLKALRRKGVVAVTYRMVPTYALSRPRDEIRVEAPAAEAR